MSRPSRGRGLRKARADRSRMETVVDLPEPFGPSRPRTPPGASVKLRSLDGRYGGVELRQAPCFEHGVVDTDSGRKGLTIRTESADQSPNLRIEIGSWVPHGLVFECPGGAFLDALGRPAGRHCRGGQGVDVQRAAVDADRRTGGPLVRHQPGHPVPARRSAVLRAQPVHAAGHAGFRLRDADSGLRFWAVEHVLRHGDRDRAGAHRQRADPQGAPPIAARHRTARRSSSAWRCWPSWRRFHGRACPTPAAPLRCDGDNHETLFPLVLAALDGAGAMSTPAPRRQRAGRAR